MNDECTVQKKNWLLMQPKSVNWTSSRIYTSNLFTILTLVHLNLMTPIQYDSKHKILYTL